jgi:2-haloalkanoic acid dehalogenase type II
MLPRVLAFDIFGTVLDWRAGLARDLALRGVPLTPSKFEAILAVQERLEHENFQPSADITSKSLVEVLGLAAVEAAAIAANVGSWPLYPDSTSALLRLLGRVPCVAMTNSDRAHGEQVQIQLGVRLTRWVCAQEVGVYKPDARFWHHVAGVTGHPLDATWWHVSAYADYDLRTARQLGLTTVFVQRPHARPGAADHTVPDLEALADLLDTLEGTS